MYRAEANQSQPESHLGCCHNHLSYMLPTFPYYSQLQTGWGEETKALPSASLHLGRAGPSMCAQWMNDILKKRFLANLSPKARSFAVHARHGPGFSVPFSFSMAVSLVFCQNPNQPAKFKGPAPLTTSVQFRARSKSTQVCVSTCVSFHNERWEKAGSESYLHFFP